MNKRYFILTILLLGLLSDYSGVWAFNKRALADSLTHYANEQARVGNIQVTRVQVRDNDVTIFTNKYLSYLAMTPAQIAQIRRIVSHYVLGNEEGNVLVFTDGYEISELTPQRYLPPSSAENHYTLPLTRHPLVSNNDRRWKANSGLDGIHIALYGSHGVYFHQATERWIFQRAKLLTTVEDLFTSSFTMPFLVPMLENAGAVVLQPRERDTQLNEVIVDDADIALQSSWHTSTATGWGFRAQPLREAENPFAFGHFTLSPAQPTQSEAQQLSYEPDIPEDGDYAVYVSYKTLPNSSQNARYEVIHAGQHTSFSVNQRMGGGTWIYIGTFHFTSGDKQQNRVLISNHGKKGEVITSDAIRFGGGMGSVARYKQPDATDSTPQQAEGVSEENKEKTILAGQPWQLQLQSGYPRYMEGARYWLQYAGIPDSVYNYTESKNDYIDDFSCRGRWINYLSGGSAANPRKRGLHIPIHLGLAFHTDAGILENDSIVGTLVIYTDKNNDKQKDYPTSVSRLSVRSYGDYVQSQIVEDIQALYAPEWKRRELKNASYSETRNPDVPTIILELLSHQHLADMRYGLDPRFRFSVSRAVYKGMLKYLHEQYGSDYVVQPLPVKDFAIDLRENGTINLRWKEQKDLLEKTAKPTYYIVYTRVDDGDWDNGTRVQKAEWQPEVEPDKRYDFYVVAGNKGGISMPSEVLSAGIAKNEKGKVLVINGFTRVGAPASFTMDSLAGFVPFSYSVPYGKEVNYIGSQYEFRKSARWVSDDDGGFGASYTDFSQTCIVGNTFDYPVMHGKALLKAGYSFVSCNASAVGEEIDKSFQVVDLLLGKQRESVLGQFKQVVDFKVFPPALRQALRTYSDNGGNLLISGAYICSDMRGEEETDFIKEVLHCQYVTQNATRSGKIQTQYLFPATLLHLNMTPNEHIIHCENPDGIAAYGDGAICVARYQDSSVGSVVAYEGKNKSLVCSFPLESCEEFEYIYTHSINWLTR